MKRLNLLRHAKSSWNNPGQNDIDRSLSNKGIYQCDILKNEVEKLGIKPDFIVASSAKRTQQTAELVFENTDITLDKELYLCSTEVIYNRIYALDENWTTAVIIFHNDTITNFVHQVAPYALDNVKTGGLIAIELPNSWMDINDNKLLKVRYFNHEEWTSLD